VKKIGPAINTLSVSVLERYSEYVILRKLEKLEVEKLLGEELEGEKG